ncbi:family 43 glycosylhydrolase [Flavobacterium sp. CF136]|uniref:family 43 glycosylhydrolase n=1 Tax=Flavobacterium sp. (strain CF136) TaxID=1144313 RepID=UPI0002718DCF|nr:family 43 glycosylhydrolase [Flavobacterium sp. CF136]EJL65821.1 Por secretion system C-terminal sorting domain-containing protein [Flavobacterium sp. CF136]
MKLRFLQFDQKFQQFPAISFTKNIVSLFTFILFLCTAIPMFAQPGIHDPSSTVRNTDGRYWHFATGNGIYTISSTSTSFGSWQTENTVFPIGTWPSWIANYVSGFAGNFWAPDVVKIGSTYYCYYSCAGDGAPAAIGLATATNLSGPWTDKGMIVAGNNAIDPAVLVDGSNMYMVYGNWQSGIDLIQLNPSTGLRLNSSRWDLVAGNVEAPYIMKNGSYYYVFFQRGLCCNGVNSGYYTQVGRSTSITGPYLDQNGISLMNDGGTTFLPNKNGRYIGPGHVGYGESTLSYHFYDGNDGGAPKLMTTTLSWSNGWPVPGSASQIIPNGTYKLVNRTGGKYLDNLGATTDGANVAQWAGGSSNNQRWVITYSGGYYKLKCVTGGKYLDNIAHTADGSTVGQWTGGTSTNQQWTISAAGPYYKIINRSNGKCVDNGGVTTDGAVMQFWPSNVSFNQQWTLEFVSSSTAKMSNAESVVSDEPFADENAGLSIVPNPVRGNEFEIIMYNKSETSITVTLTNMSGQTVYTKNLGITKPGEFRYTVNASTLSKGTYLVNLSSETGNKTAKIIRN